MVLTLRRFGLLLLTYSLLRVGFHLWNWPAFAAATPGALLGAYARGLVFDFSALALVNAPWLALSLALPPRWQVRRGVRGALSALWLVLNGPFIGLNLMDYAYYGFINRRSTDEFLMLTADIARQAPVMVVRYWYIVVAIGLLLWGLAAAYGRLSRRYEHRLRTQPPTPRPAWWRLALPRVLAVGAIVLGIRGSVGLKPLRVGDAFTQTPAVLGNLTLNSTFTFLKSINDEPLERRAWLPSLAAARAALDPTGALARYEHPAPRPTTGPPADTARPNVVVVLLESFASEFTGFENGGRGGYTPFLDSLAAAPGALFFPDHYANGHKSIEAVPSTLMGFPALTDEPLITSMYQANTATGLPDALRAVGYRTAFFHGAANGTMGFKPFSRRIGVTQYFGLKEYPGGAQSPDFDGTWGILDAPYLRYVSQRLGDLPQPFFATIFTLTSHEPYPVPEALKARYPVGTLPIHQSLGYTDDALRHFFAAARRQPWYSRTLFILLADHAQQSDRAGYQNVLGHAKTPLVLFRAGARWPKLRTPRVTQRADVPATVLYYTGVPAGGRLLPYGQSVLDTLAGPGRAWLRDGGSLWLIHPDYVTELTANQQLHFYRYGRHALGPRVTPPSAVRTRYSTEIKAADQFTNNGLLDNALYSQ